MSNFTLYDQIEWDLTLHDPNVKSHSESWKTKRK